MVARKRGFTVDTCISVIPADRESAQFQGLPTGEKVSKFARCSVWGGVVSSV